MMLDPFGRALIPHFSLERVECLKNVHDTVELFKSLGFCIHPDKSVLEPSQKLTFLGFELDSVRE